MIKNKIPHLGAPYETNRSKIGAKLAELLTFRLSQDEQQEEEEQEEQVGLTRFARCDLVRKLFRI